MNKEHGIIICPGVTVSDNYIRLTNKPKINGIELCGNKTSTQLNLLSNQIGEYSEIDLATAGNDSDVLVFPQAGQPSKVRVGDIKSGMFSTTEAVTEETVETMEVGEFIFKKLED